MNQASRWLAAVALGVLLVAGLLGPRNRAGSGAPSTILGLVP